MPLAEGATPIVEFEESVPLLEDEDEDAEFDEPAPLLLLCLVSPTPRPTATATMMREMRATKRMQSLRERAKRRPGVFEAEWGEDETSGSFVSIVNEKWEAAMCY